MKHIIRTSDRIQFKRCRRAWDIGSKIRQNYEPIAMRTPLEFGTAIHSFQEVYYDPEKWTWDPEVRYELAKQAFLGELKNQKQLHLRNRGLEYPDEELRLEFLDREVLGLGMIAHYHQWAPQEDAKLGLTPVYSEIEFEAPILVPKGEEDNLPPGFRAAEETRQLQKYTWVEEAEAWLWVSVFYQGRIDAIWQDSNGNYWLVDHKTTARMMTDSQFLELDEQMKSYAWAVQVKLGIKIHGVIYQELYKGFPQEPKALANVRKGCSYSTAKNQDTSYLIAKKFFQENDTYAYEHGLYDDYLQFLKYEGKQYFHRWNLRYHQRELENLEEQICWEAIDMLNDPRCYPNPQRYGDNCTWCDHRMLCIVMNEGGDQEWVKATYYIKRKASA